MALNPILLFQLWKNLILIGELKKIKKIWKSLVLQILVKKNKLFSNLLILINLKVIKLIKKIYRFEIFLKISWKVKKKQFLIKKPKKKIPKE